MKTFRCALTACALGLISTTATADGMFYLGAGPDDDNPDITGNTVPFVIGALALQDETPFVWGLDFAGEGEMLDSTFGGDSLRQALSVNFLIGGNLGKTETMRVDAAAILGARESVADCPDSFLGFQCYADREPDVEYDFNYGGLISLSFRKVSIGVRATGESAQAFLGWVF